MSEVEASTTLSVRSRQREAQSCVEEVGRATVRVMRGGCEVEVE